MDSLVASQLDQQQAGFNGARGYPTFTDQDFDFPAVDFDPFDSSELSQPQDSLLNVSMSHEGFPRHHLETQAHLSTFGISQSQQGYFDSSFSGSLSTPSTSIPNSPISTKQVSSATENRQEELLSHLKQAMEGTNLQMPNLQEQEPPAAISSSSDLSSSSVAIPVPKLKSRQRGSMSCCQCRKLKKKCEKVGNSKNCFDCLRKGIECSWPENPGNINRRKSQGNVKKASGSKDKMNV